MAVLLHEAIGIWRVHVQRCIEGILIALSVSAHSGCEQEATYQGNSTSAWASAMRSDSAGMRQQAADALVAIGRPAVPHLIEIVKDTSASVEVRCIAIESLGRLGLEAAEAVPAMSDAMSDPDRRICIRAVRAVGEMGPAGKQAASGLIAAAKRASRTLDEELMSELESTAAKIGVHIR